MDLFASRQRTRAEEPLASRMRPSSLAEFAGQEHIVGPGRLLRRAIEADRLGSQVQVKQL
jgi:putative ATPase